MLAHVASGSARGGSSGLGSGSQTLRRSIVDIARSRERTHLSWPATSIHSQLRFAAQILPQIKTRDAPKMLPRTTASR